MRLSHSELSDATVEVVEAILLQAGYCFHFGDPNTGVTWDVEGEPPVSESDDGSDENPGEGVWWWTFGKQGASSYEVSDNSFDTDQEAFTDAMRDMASNAKEYLDSFDQRNETPIVINIDNQVGDGEIFSLIAPAGLDGGEVQAKVKAILEQIDTDNGVALDDDGILAALASEGFVRPEFIVSENLWPGSN